MDTGAPCLPLGFGAGVAGEELGQGLGGGLVLIEDGIDGVEANILGRHLKGCVSESFKSGTPEDRARKIDEVIDALGKFRK